MPASIVYRRTRKKVPVRRIRHTPKRWVGTSPLRKSLVYKARHSRLNSTRLRRQPHRKWIGTIQEAPVLQGVIVYTGTPTKIFLKYDKPLDETSIPARTDFVVYDDATLMTVDLVEVFGYTVVLTVH